MKHMHPADAKDWADIATASYFTAVWQRTRFDRVCVACPTIAKARAELDKLEIPKAGRQGGVYAIITKPFQRQIFVPLNYPA